jgi:hypothetical protein
MADNRERKKKRDSNRLEKEIKRGWNSNKIKKWEGEGFWQTKKKKRKKERKIFVG